MRIIETLRMIIINLIQNKFKVLLTSLGIVVGTITIILVIAIGQGGEEKIAAQFSNMSAENIYVSLNFTRDIINDIENIPKITLEHLEQVKEENPYLKGIYIRASVFKYVTINGEKETLNLTAVSDGYSEISNFNIEYGADLTEEDMNTSTRAVVLGHAIAKRYFNEPEDAVGGSIRINGYSYEIIGVMKKKAEGLQGLNPDDSIFLPYSSAEDYGLFDFFTFPQVVAYANNISVIDKAIERLKSTLDYVLEDINMYTIEDAGSRIEAATQSARTMKMLLVSVATIVFLVSGIGIMNVLFVSVKERTREIGILKALGTSKMDILLQFLLESIGMGVFGGIIGIIISYIILPFMRYTEIPVATSVGGKIIAMTFAVFTSAIFGLYPAYKASNLKPIDALNHE